MIARLLGNMISGPRSGTPSPWSDFWYRPAASASPSGVVVTPIVAMQTSAVYSSIKVLAESFGVLPWFTYERRTDGQGRDVARGHPLFHVLHDQPNNWQTSYDWRVMMMTHLCLRGNSYNQIVPGARGGVEQLVPLHPDRIEVELLPSYQRIYKYTQSVGGTRIFRQDEIMHTMWLSTNGIVGDDPILLYGDTVGHQKAQESHGARLFKNGGKPSVILKHPGELKPDASKRLADSWVQAFSQQNSHRPAVLEEGMDVSELGMTNEASQWLESRKLSRSEIAGIFRVPAHMINDMESSTFSNIEQQDLFLSKHTMLAWVKNFEQVVQRDLLEGDERFFTELSLDGLQRGDLKTRTEFYTKMWERGMMSQNEVRRLENLNPIEGGERYWVPINMMDMNAPRPDNTGRGTGTATPEGRIEDGNGDEPKAIVDQPESVVIDPPEALDDPQPVQVEPLETTSMADRLSPIVSDVSRRIANTEATALARRAKHASDNDKRYEVWAADWFATKGISLASQMLKPLFAAAGVDDGSKYVGDMIDAAVRRLETSGDIAATVAGWQDTRAAEIAAILSGEVLCQTE